MGKSYKADIEDIDGPEVWIPFGEIIPTKECRLDENSIIVDEVWFFIPRLAGG